LASSGVELFIIARSTRREAVSVSIGARATKSASSGAGGVGEGAGTTRRANRRSQSVGEATRLTVSAARSVATHRGGTFRARFAVSVEIETLHAVSTASGAASAAAAVSRHAADAASSGSDEAHRARGTVDSAGLIGEEVHRTRQAVEGARRGLEGTETAGGASGLTGSRGEGAGSTRTALVVGDVQEGTSIANGRPASSARGTSLCRVETIRAVLTESSASHVVVGLRRTLGAGDGANNVGVATRLAEIARGGASGVVESTDGASRARSLGVVVGEATRLTVGAKGDIATQREATGITNFTYTLEAVLTWVTVEASASRAASRAAAAVGRHAADRTSHRGNETHRARSA